MDNNSTNKVDIVDIKMPFVSMVVFMVKATIASIPALIILSGIGFMVFGILGGLLGGLGRF